MGKDGLTEDGVCLDELGGYGLDRTGFEGGNFGQCRAIASLVE